MATFSDPVADALYQNIRRIDKEKYDPDFIAMFFYVICELDEISARQRTFDQERLFFFDIFSKLFEEDLPAEILLF